MTTRRRFLGTLGAVGAWSLGTIAVARCASARAATSRDNRRLVVVFLRGAVDGLNVVVPFHDPAYRAARPHIAIAPPGGEMGALKLDDYFGMHPALWSLQPEWQGRRLAFVHACGSPDATRSHFDAQDYMESGTPGTRLTSDGWMNRLLGVLPGQHAATEAIAFTPTMPRILAGPMPATNAMPDLQGSRRAPLDRPWIAEAFDSLYDGNDALSLAYQEAQSAREELLANLAAEAEDGMNGGEPAARIQTPSRGAPAAGGFVEAADRIGDLLRDDRAIRLAFIALGGWDTHVNQGAGSGQLANHLQPLATGLVRLRDRLGDAFADTLIVVLSEFGRTVHENGNGGTDHGHGNAMWLFGGTVGGGKVYGDWPGLSPSALFQGRDLAVTTDFRHVLARAMERHLRLPDSAIAHVLPGAPPDRSRLGGLIRG